MPDRMDAVQTRCAAVAVFAAAVDRCSNTRAYAAELNAVFPLEIDIPKDMADLAGQIDEGKCHGN